MPSTEHLKKWNEHLAAYRKKNPGKSMRVCMQEAAKTYKKATPR